MMIGAHGWRSFVQSLSLKCLWYISIVVLVFTIFWSAFDDADDEEDNKNNNNWYNMMNNSIYNDNNDKKTQIKQITFDN